MKVRLIDTQSMKEKKSLLQVFQYSIFFQVYTTKFSKQFMKTYISAATVPSWFVKENWVYNKRKPAERKQDVNPEYATLIKIWKKSVCFKL